MAASHKGSRTAARAEADSGAAPEVEAVHTYLYAGYRVVERWTLTRARVTGPAGGDDGEDGPADDASPEVPLEGDAVDEEDGEAGPEARFEDYEAWLEGSIAAALELGPELGLEGITGAGPSVPTGGGRRVESLGDDDRVTTSSYANRKECSSK
jgi:hypothetical protein